MTTIVDETLNVDRVDVYTGAVGAPFDMHVFLLATTQGYVDAASDLVTMITNMYSGREVTPRVHCTTHALDRNVISIVLTEAGLAQWKHSIVSADGIAPAALRQQFANDTTAVVRDFLRVHKAEGAVASHATYDLYFPCGEMVHWAGKV